MSDDPLTAAELDEILRTSIVAGLAARRDLRGILTRCKATIEALEAKVVDLTHAFDEAHERGTQQGIRVERARWRRALRAHIRGYYGPGVTARMAMEDFAAALTTRTRKTGR